MENYCGYFVVVCINHYASWLFETLPTKKVLLNKHKLNADDILLIEAFLLCV